MAYKIATRMEAPRPIAAEDLRRAFETAVCKIHQADQASRKRPEYRAPIFQRGALSQAGTEKRALSDAAQALALLWKV